MSYVLCLMSCILNYEGKDFMKYKEYVKEFGDTCACTLRLTNHWKTTGRIVIGDLWIHENSHPANEEWSLQLLVKTAHKQYLKEILGETELERGDWTLVTSTIDDVKLLAVRFQDLKYKQFISTCSTSTEGPPRVAKHHENISRPQVAADYLKYAAGIDIHNHVWQGTAAFEDVWKTKDRHIRQFSGIMSFVFTNAFLATKYFPKKDLVALAI